MLIESDCIPLRKSWIEEIHEEWSNSRKFALGHWDGSGRNIKPPISHMNGNMVIHPRLLDHLPIYDTNIPVWGWDMAYWPIISKFATPSRLMFSDYKLNTKSNPLNSCDDLWKPRRHTYPDNPLVGQDIAPCWLHGVKGDKGVECVRSRLII